MATEPTEDDGGALSLAAERRVDAACLRFEDSWHGGRPEQIEELVADITGPERRALLRELIRLDLSYRARCGARPGVAEYAARFPQDAADLDGWGPTPATAARGPVSSGGAAPHLPG
jgi:hypothetical protein